jgi:hypothetical protein
MPLLTYTDRVLLAEKHEVLSLADIAVSLSRQPRFGGHTRRWWSVLDHTLFCEELAHRFFGGDRLLRLAMLLHDAHEAVTGDVPTDAKGQELRWLQRDLDRAIMGRYFPGGYPAYHDLYEVKQVDLLALRIEAQVVGPPVSRKRLEEVEPRFKASLGGAPTVDARAHALLKGLLAPGEVAAMVRPRLLGIVPLETKQEQHPAVLEYLTRVTKLM